MRLRAVGRAQPHGRVKAPAQQCGCARAEVRNLRVGRGLRRSSEVARGRRCATSRSREGGCAAVGLRAVRRRGAAGRAQVTVMPPSTAIVCPVT
ncbi:hypothetical protein ACFPM0_16340 [Pseudonocardia sulfidoxydans]|uniref:hypothetical protein n=1 Tax=Pseudonocardia sulfidoxydans TaxID=54011 RepID=UPI00361ABFB6